MNTLNIHELAGACRIFIDYAYPDGPDTVPVRKRPYYHMGDDCRLEDYLPPAPLSVGVCQDLTRHELRGYEFRLGSAHYPHLKLRVQLMAYHETSTWVYSVDTHDGLFKASEFADSAEAVAWRVLTEQNRLFKHQIEEALAQAGYMTPILLLRIDLTPTA